MIDLGENFIVLYRMSLTCSFRNFMNCLSSILVSTFIFVGVVSAQERRFLTSSRLVLGRDNELSASVRVGDFDSNGTLDVVVANGRHWPGQNFVFLNHGRARFSVQRRLGDDSCTSYAAEPADLDGDGDLDIVVGNDRAPNQVFLNDGSGRFGLATVFGEVSSVRSLTLVDLDRDGDQDVLATSRGMKNQIYLNNGKGQFRAGNKFGHDQDSTIDVAVADLSGDGHLDLVLANRDNQQNAILINDGRLNFNTVVKLGSSQQQSRAVVVADLNGDQNPDLIFANVGQANTVHLSSGQGSFADPIEFGSKQGASYSLSVADMDNDQDLDLIVGNVGDQNAVYLNQGDGKSFSEVRFGAGSDASYGVEIGDFDGDSFQDIVVANSNSPNYVYLNRPTQNSQKEPVESPPQRSQSGMTQSGMTQSGMTQSGGRTSSSDWHPFLNNPIRGVAEGYPVRKQWNADKKFGDLAGVQWSTEVPGLGHSSPVIRGDRIFLATAIASQGRAPLKVGRGGQPDAADDHGEQSWVVLCYDRSSGKELWRKTAYRGKPRATRHAKATHANSSVAVGQNRVVAFFGSEGIHCYDLDGNLQWSRDLGVINISKYGIGWGYASSPVISDDRIVIVCDDPQKPFVAALRLTDGSQVWRMSRTGICERSWGTPCVHTSTVRSQVVVNGWPWIVSYDFAAGKELWRIRGGGDNPVPTPFEANGWIYITNAHGADSPIFVVRPDAEGDVTPKSPNAAGGAIVWSTRRGGSYMSTPVVYGNYLYLGNTNGVVRCFDARTGEKIYEKRLGTGAAIISSLVAADGKVFCASEDGVVYVLRAGPTFEVLAENHMGNPCFATPAIANGVLYFRTTEKLIAIQ